MMTQLIKITIVHRIKPANILENIFYRLGIATQIHKTISKGTINSQYILGNLKAFEHLLLNQTGHILWTYIFKNQHFTYRITAECQVPIQHRKITNWTKSKSSTLLSLYLVVTNPSM